MKFKNVFFALLLIAGTVLSLALFAENGEPAGGFKQFADYYHFALWDTDEQAGGRFLIKSEFFMGLNYSGLFNTFNTDNNIGISLEEVRPVTSDLFAGLDKDGDGMVSAEEFTRYSVTDTGIYRLLNRDGRPGLTQAEFTTGVFDYWNENTDDFLQEYELSGGIFNLVDLDRDGLISFFELQYFGP